MEKWIRVITFTYPHEAYLAKIYLEALNIEVDIKDELTVQVHNFLSNAVGGVKLYVEESKVDEALLLLVDGGYIEETDTESTPKLEIFSVEYKEICPYCKSENVGKKSSPSYIFALSILLLSFPFPFVKRTYFCYDCRKEWKVRKMENT